MHVTYSDTQWSHVQLIISVSIFNMLQVKEDLKNNQKFTELQGSHLYHQLTLHVPYAVRVFQNHF